MAHGPWAQPLPVPVYIHVIYSNTVASDAMKWARPEVACMQYVTWIGFSLKWFKLKVWNKLHLLVPEGERLRCAAHALALGHVPW